VELSNCTVWDNPGGGEPEVGFWGDALSVKCRNSIIEGSGGSADWVNDGSADAPWYLVDLGGNLDLDPGFAGPGDYRLEPGSPAIDAGAPVAGVGAVDLAGGERTSGPAIDIGAYEFYVRSTRFLGSAPT
jgi:hypothetical protein